MAQGTVAPAIVLQFFDNNGAEAAGFKLFAYAAGTTTKINTYQDVGLSTPNSNPIILDSAGRCTIFLVAATSYKFVLAPPTDTDPPTSPLWTRDNITSVPASSLNIDITGTFAENVIAGATVYLSAGDGGRNAGQWYNTSAVITYESSTAEAVGFALAAVTAGNTGTIRLTGQMTGLVGLSPGSTYFLANASGTISATAGNNARPVGIADSATTMLMSQWIFQNAGIGAPGILNDNVPQTISGVKTFSGAVTFQSTTNFQNPPNFQPGTSGADQLCFVQISVAPTGIPASVSANTASEVALTAVTGLQAGDYLVGVQKAGNQAGLYIVPGERMQGGVTAANACTVKYINVTTGAIVPTAAETYVFTVLRAAATGTSQLSVVQLTVNPTGIPGTVAASTTATAALTGITGLLSGDILIAVQQVSAQGGLTLLPADATQGGVTGAGAATVRYSNVSTGSITPNSGTSYRFTVLRSSSLGTQTLTPFYFIAQAPSGAPGSVSAQTTSSNTLTVSQIVSSDVPILINRNLGAAGASADTAYTTLDDNFTLSGGNLNLKYVNQTVGSYTVQSTDTYNVVVLRTSATLLNANSALASGVLNAQVSVAGIGSVSTGETILFATQIPAGLLNGAGKSIRIKAWGSNVNAVSHTVKVYFGATVVLNFANSSAAQNWTAEAGVMCATATTQTAYGTGLVGTSGSNVLGATTNTSPTETLTQPIMVKVTGQGTSTNDVQGNGMIVEVIGA